MGGVGWLLALVHAVGDGRQRPRRWPRPWRSSAWAWGPRSAPFYDIAIGDIDPAEAGSASGSLSAVQQLANAIGPAIVTTIYFDALAGGQGHAMTVSLLAVIGIGVLSALAIPLLPRQAQPQL